jgi:hypothetical protein
VRPAALLLVMMVLLLAAPAVRAEEPRFRAAASASRIGQEDTVLLEITLEGDATSAEVAERPSSPDFRLVQGPNVSSQFQFFNGQASSKKIVSFVFFPLRTGQLSLPAVKFRLDGKIYTTQPVPVEVVAGSVGRQPAPTPDPFQDPFDRFGRARRDDEPPPDPGQDIFARMEASTTRVFPGQPVALNLVLYTRIQVTGFDVDKEGKIEGFWVENVDQPGQKRPEAERRTVDGREYYAQPLRRWVLFPMRAGAYPIEPWILKFMVVVSSRSFFGFDRRTVVMRRTEPLTIQVDDFPAAGRPADFTGLCGRFDLTASLDKPTVAAGEGATFRVTVRGEGNLRSVQELRLPPISGAKVYTPKTQDDVRLEGGTLRGSRTWEYVLIPLQEGRLEMPILRLSYFDPAARQYRTLATPRLTLAATPGTVDAGVLAAGPAAVPLSLKGRDIRYIATGADLAGAAGPPIHRRPWFYPAFILLFGLAAGLAAVDERRRRLRRDTRSWARSRAALRARKELKACARLGRTGFSETFFQSLDRLLQSYLEGRFGLSRIELTGTHLRQVLADAGVEPAAVDELVALRQLCESSRYAPSARTDADPAALLERARRLIARLEGEAA